MSIRRLEKFMLHLEVSKPSCTIKNQVATQSIPVYLKNATARWDELRDYTLQNVDLTVHAGNFVAIVGQIGSGKSSLLQTILGELPLNDGVLEINGRISFASQKPWVFASSIRQNILFGQPMNETRYNEVLRVCQLNQDINSMPHRDSTIAGERGINLSGGQRARINLARALYSDADIYLLDDPLSAVDAHVASRIVHECICGFLKDKTRILVTHQVQYLKPADLIVVMSSGSVQARGSFVELRNMNLDFMKIFQDVNEKEETNESEDGGDTRHSDETTKKKDEETAVADGPADVTETRTSGKVSSTVFLAYWKASKNTFLVVLMVVLFLVRQIMVNGCDYLIAFWVNNEVASWTRTENDTLDFQWSGALSRDGIIYIYSALTLSIVFIFLFQTFAYYGVCMRASKNLHADMFRSIVRTVMYFYNTNPAGRILNRYRIKFARKLGQFKVLQSVRVLPNIEKKVYCSTCGKP